MRITKDQLKGALVLLGLEFQDAEIDMMLRQRQPRAGQLRSSPQGRYPLRYRARFRLPSRPARPQAHQRPAALRHHHPHGGAPSRRPSNLEDAGLLAGHRTGAPGALARRLVHRPHQDVPRAHEEVFAQAALPHHPHRRRGARRRRHSRSGNQGRQVSRAAARHSFRRQGSFRYQGHSDHLGRRAVQKRVPEYDATCVERLRKAGAVLIGQTLHGRAGAGRPLVQGPHQESVDAGTRRRATTTRGSSGSSAGSASATSAGLVGFSLGTETLGSIVSPSGVCGTVGLRPTYGRVSRHGAMALELDHGQDRRHLPRRGRLRHRAERHLRTRRARPHRGRRPVPLGAAQAAQAA